MNKLMHYFLFILCIVSTFLLTINSLTMVSASEVYPYKGAITSATLTVHSTPDYLDKSYVTELAYGSVVEVLEKVGETLTKIKYDGDKIGYVSGNYLINLGDITLTDNVEGFETYEEYCNTLVTKGFDKSYCPYLYRLHVKYPKWTFTPDVINETLKDAADNQEGTGVLNTNNTNYWLNNKVVELYYHEVKAHVLASIMDPRNSLYESRIFQFLDLEDSSKIHNDKTLATIANGGNLASFYAEFKAAAEFNKVNAVHLMARSRQEGANTKGYSATTGLYTTNTMKENYAGHRSHQGYSLDGYYNFYNIGSYQDADYDYTVQRGLAHAAGFLADASCINVDPNDSSKATYSETNLKSNGEVCGKLSYQRPWNSASKAVSGGAEFIAGDYIRVGQDNMYYQKFNVASYTQSKRHTHQYMTNVAAPIDEATTMYKAYNAGGLLSEAFNFVIPVYKDMPEASYQPINKSSNSRLSSITFDDKNFTNFDADVVEYSFNYVTTEDTFKVGAKTEHSQSKLTGTGDYTFVDGVVQVKLTVTAEDGSSTTYVINVKKVVPEEIITVDSVVSKMGVKVNDSVMYGISPDTAISTLINTVTKNKGEAKVTDANGKTKASGAFVTGDKITIIGTSEEKTYSIAVRGDINGDGIIKINDLILVQSHILEKNKLSNLNFFAADVNYDGIIKINDLILVQSHILEKNNL